MMKWTAVAFSMMLSLSTSLWQDHPPNKREMETIEQILSSPKPAKDQSNTHSEESLVKAATLEQLRLQDANTIETEGSSHASVEELPSSKNIPDAPQTHKRIPTSPLLLLLKRERERDALKVQAILRRHLGDLGEPPKAHANTTTRNDSTPVLLASGPDLSEADKEEILLRKSIDPDKQYYNAFGPYTQLFKYQFGPLYTRMWGGQSNVSSPDAGSQQAPPYNPNGEQACEGLGYDRDKCNLIGCCKWGEGSCWSAVGNGKCATGGVGELVQNTYLSSNPEVWSSVNNWVKPVLKAGLGSYNYLPPVPIVSEGLSRLNLDRTYNPLGPHWMDQIQTQAAAVGENLLEETAFVGQTRAHPKYQSSRDRPVYMSPFTRARLESPLMLNLNPSPPLNLFGFV